MSEKVVGIRGENLPTPTGEPVPGVVEILEKALAEARSGHLVSAGIAIVYDHGTGLSYDRTFACRGLTGADLYLSCELLKQAAGMTERHK